MSSQPSRDRHAGQPGQRVGVDDQPAEAGRHGVDPHRLAAGRRQGDRRHGRAGQVRRRAVVRRNRQVRRELGRIECHRRLASCHDNSSMTWATPGRTVEVSEGIYAYIQPDGSWYINNTGFITGGGGVISIDTCSTRAADAGLPGRCRGGDRPARPHPGQHPPSWRPHLRQLPAATGHDRRSRALPDEVLASGPPANLGIWTDVEWGDLTVGAAVPDLPRPGSRCGPVTCGATCVTWGRRRTRPTTRSCTFRSGRCCSRGTCCSRGGTPFLLMGSIAGAIEVLEEVRAPARRPGDRPGARAGGRARDDRRGARVPAVRAGCRRARPGGRACPPLDAARQADLGQFAGWLDSERIVGNLHRGYAELDGAERGQPIDLIAAVGDMITYNGGQPLTCHA